MIYVSLPVHTQPAVIAGQVRNFARFFPEAAVVLHVSAEARFELPRLVAALRSVGCDNMLINPVRSSTAWGNILQAHLTNVAYIRSLGDASRICLHASNDMLVRPGVATRLGAGHNFCNRRIVHPGTLWRFGHAALADTCLARLRRQFGNVDVIASQIEGSSYEAAVLYEIADIIAATPLVRPPIAYPREEVWLSTVAHALHARVDGKPYVFSELHRFDRVFWQVLAHVNPVIGTRSRASHVIRRTIEYLMIKSGFHRMNRTWVDRVARDDVRRLTPYQMLCDGNNIWQVFERHGLFGVKRVRRRAGCALRLYIDALPCGQRMRPASETRA